jgi:hypothetical protein
VAATFLQPLLHRTPGLRPSSEAMLRNGFLKLASEYQDDAPLDPADSFFHDSDALLPTMRRAQKVLQELEQQMPMSNPSLQSSLLDKLREQQLEGGVATDFSASLFECCEDASKALIGKSCGDTESTGTPGTADRLRSESTGTENTCIVTDVVLRAEEGAEHLRRVSHSNAQTFCREGPSISNRQMPDVAPYLPERFGDQRLRLDTAREDDTVLMHSKPDISPKSKCVSFAS